jgi:hypothetical protein
MPSQHIVRMLGLRAKDLTEGLGMHSNKWNSILHSYSTGWHSDRSLVYTIQVQDMECMDFVRWSVGYLFISRMQFNERPHKC